ncbi:hypothetical protein KOW79_005151 [Hemibagrus wyckioides]|uniref:Uncharacterized protein n=1 Tax=Hemibagrus wyckioides TaxID=337641 RepID=A0A9D3NZ19_9TELE|nr:hypothetical protein KOW79_005151 [Hemibagrus wyckioides]
MVYAERQPAQSQDSRACANDQAQVFPMMPLPLTVLFGQQECQRQCSLVIPHKPDGTASHQRAERETVSVRRTAWQPMEHCTLLGSGSERLPRASTLSDAYGCPSPGQAADTAKRRQSPDEAEQLDCQGASDPGRVPCDMG